METGIVVALIGLVGILLTAIIKLTETNTQKKNGLLSTRKKSIFLLLEIRRTLTIELDFLDKESDDFSLVLNRYLKLHGFSESITSEQQEKLKQHLDGIILARKTSGVEDIEKEFQLTIAKLSEEHPFIAHSLKFKANSQRLIEIQRQFAGSGFKEIRDNITNIPANSNFDKFCKNKLIGAIDESRINLLKTQQRFIKEIIEDLNYDILLLSKSCGTVFYIKNRKIIKKPPLIQHPFSYENDFIEFLDSYMEPIIRTLREIREIEKTGQIPVV